MRRGLGIAATAALFCLAVAAPALAWRRPTARQRRAITHVAERVHHAGSEPVRVSDIKVSTVGPWALVTVTIDVGGEPDSAGAVLERVNGRWRVTRHSPGTEGIQCGIGMPAKDRTNLGLGGCTP